jgi:hypothetical protein
MCEEWERTVEPQLYRSEEAPTPIPSSRQSAPSSIFPPPASLSPLAKASTTESWQDSRAHSWKDPNQRCSSPSLQVPGEQATTTVAQRSPRSAPRRPACTPSCNPATMAVLYAACRPYHSPPLHPDHATIPCTPSLRGSPPHTRLRLAASLNTIHSQMYSRTFVVEPPQASRARRTSISSTPPAARQHAGLASL